MKCKTCGGPVGRYSRDGRCRKCRSYSTRQDKGDEPTPRTKLCEECGRQLSPRARSPLCADCRKAKREAERKANAPRCKECGKPVGHSNRTGLCQSCYRASDEHRKRRDELWLQVNHGLRTGDPCHGSER